jgi:putative PEP-CTERM system histidine kinase
MRFGEQILFALSGLWALGIAVGALARKARRLTAYSFSVGMFLLALATFLALAVSEASDLDMSLSLERFRLLVLSLMPVAWLPFSLCYSRGNSREFLLKWKPILIAACLLPILPAAAFFELVTIDRNVWELGVRPLIELRWPGKAVHVVVLAFTVLVLMNLERTFRAAVGTLRWRIKFAVLGLGLIFIARIYASSQALLFSSSDTAWATLNAIALVLGCALITISFLRASLSAVEVYPSLTVLQNSLTVILAGAYLFAVGVLAKLVKFLGGDAAFPIKAFLILLALVALGLLLASDRVRLIARRFVSRHFHRPSYDYRALWRSFTERTSSVVDEAAYARELANLICDAAQTLSVSVWLTRESRRRLVLVASTALRQAQPSQVEMELRGLGEHLAQHPEPIALADSREKWVQELKRCNPDQFNEGGAQLCVPLIANRQLLGMLIVADKVNGVPFSYEDFELFKCIGAQSASGLLNLQLAQQLVRAKEMEAFQTMAAFFAHDLKNTASSLSLLLQNLPAQMENPAFRQDAFRAVSKALAKLNDLISRLGLLRHKVQLMRIPSDLNHVVQTVLDSVALAPEVSIARSLNELPKISIDPEQVQKVVTNLLINAREAIAHKGEIQIETSSDGNWAVLSVRDTGCGMSTEFLNRSLFRPFQTTKKNGIGIGMFHCKTIMEAHQGRIEAESQVGKGTTFRVLFPIAGGKA